MPSVGGRAPLLFHYQRRPPSAAGSPRTGRPQPSHSSPSVGHQPKRLQKGSSVVVDGVWCWNPGGSRGRLLFWNNLLLPVLTFVFLDTRTVVLECWPQDWRSARRDPCILGLQLVFSFLKHILFDCALFCSFKFFVLLIFWVISWIVQDRQK